MYGNVEKETRNESQGRLFHLMLLLLTITITITIIHDGMVLLRFRREYFVNVPVQGNPLMETLARMMKNWLLGSWRHNHIPKNLFTLRWKLKVVQEWHFEWFILTLTEVEKKLSVDQFSDPEFLKFWLEGQTKFRNGRGLGWEGFAVWQLIKFPLLLLATKADNILPVTISQYQNNV